MDVDRGAGAIAEGHVQIVAPAALVWSVIADIPAWPTWQRDVKWVMLEGPVGPGTLFRWKSGPSSLVSTLQVVDAPREIAWTGVTMGIHAVHVFHFESNDGGTLARSAESFRGMIPRLFKGYSRTILKRGLDRVLASLKAEAERRV